MYLVIIAKGTCSYLGGAIRNGKICLYGEKLQSYGVLGKTGIVSLSEIAFSLFIFRQENKGSGNPKLAAKSPESGEC